MALKRGIRAVKESKTEQGAQAGDSRRLIIKAGESITLRLFGDFENEQDPVIGTTHYIKRLQKGQQYKNCGGNAEEGSHAGCVYCYAKNNGDKGIGRNDRAFFHAKDYRKYHKLDNEVKVLKPGRVFRPGVANRPDDYELTKYPWCTASTKGRPCQFCAQGNEAKPVGHRHWELSVSFADQLVNLQGSLREFCRCGSATEDGEGTIYVTQYLCSNPNCGQAVDFSPEAGKPVAYCGHCKQNLVPNEEIACTGCENAQRTDLQDWLIKVTRNGESTDTTYNFEAVKCKPPSEEEIEDAQKNRPDFEALLAPEPAELQARVLGIPCPFATAGHGAQEYGSDMPDDGGGEQVYDGAYEEEEQPAPKPSPRAPAPKVPAPRAPAPRAPAPAPGRAATPRAPAPAPQAQKPQGGKPPKFKFNKPAPQPQEADEIPYE